MGVIGLQANSLYLYCARCASACKRSRPSIGDDRAYPPMVTPPPSYSDDDRSPITQIMIRADGETL
ncbi:MAG TPA: hypothetical protein IGS52_22105 [Oscillatoriaceae cyanobacterium M33_DOE_052]|nr:hypothetical protein [Oscillatoriaceae cyanobacterium M33_DOE_052]